MASEAGHILVVDDSRVLRRILGEMLKSHGYTFEMAENGQKALAILHEKVFDIVLLDMIMPEMDGYETLQAIKGDSDLRHIPVIMVSSLEEVDNIVRCIEGGAEDYLPKPPNQVLLKARIGACLDKKRLRDAEIDNQRRLKQLNETLEIRNRFIRETFGKYLSDEIVETILETPEGLKLGGEKRVLTIMMADLRGFTSIGERLPAEEVVGIINNFLETMTEIIFKHGGTIDEFIGDAILVIFGAPVPHADSAVRAVACALEMQIAMEAVNLKNAQRGYPQVAMGIGINTGSVVVGNIGSKKRIKYGVVGKNVNLTSRIESFTVGGQIFISESTMKACGGLLRIGNVMEVQPKGIQMPLTIYETGGIGGAYNLFLPEKKPAELHVLESPLSIGFAILSDKDAGTELHRSKIVKMKDKSVEIEADMRVERFSNLRISIFNADGIEVAKDIFGKVLHTYAANSNTFNAILTSINPEAEKKLHELTNLRINEPERGE